MVALLVESDDPDPLTVATPVAPAAVPVCADVRPDAVLEEFEGPDAPDELELPDPVPFDLLDEPPPEPPVALPPVGVGPAVGFPFTGLPFVVPSFPVHGPCPAWSQAGGNGAISAR